MVCARANAAGFLLIEALVALLLFSLGVLGMVALQARASQESLSSEYRAKAALLANELVTTMWANLSTDCATTLSSQLTVWKTTVATSEADGGLLPNATGACAYSSTTGVATITVTWKPVSAKSTDTSNSYVTKVAQP